MKKQKNALKPAQVDALQRYFVRRTTRPQTRHELAYWVEAYLDLRLPPQPVCPDHDTPLDYLEHAFFERGDCVVWACRGGGKTLLGAVATLLDLLFKPGIQIRILGGSMEQSTKMYTYLRRLVDKGFRAQLAGEPTLRSLAFHNGSRVEVLAQSEKAVRGQRVQKVRCDEVELFTEEIWEAAQLTTRSLGASARRNIGAPDPETPKRLHSDTVPIRGCVEALSTMHVPGGLMTRVLKEAQDRGVRVFRWCVWDVLARCRGKACQGCELADGCRGRARNAHGLLAPEDVAAMRGRVSAATWEHEMLCWPPVRQDAVFRGFRSGAHLQPFALEEDGHIEGRPVEWVCGIDFGFAGAFVCLWLALETGVPRAAARVWVVHELVRQRVRLERCVALMREYVAAGTVRLSTVFCDVAGAARNPQTGLSDVGVLKNAGLDVRCRSMRIEDGLETINALIEPAAGPTRLTVHPRCTRLTAALENYRRDAAGRPIKDGVHDHLIDALRYALVGRLGGGGKVARRGY